MNPRERVPLGRTALTVTRFGLGTAPLAGLFEAVDEANAMRVIERAWEAGIRFFDTAPLYGHGLGELRLGKVLKGKPREEFTLASKVGRLLRADVPPEPGQSFRGTPPVNPMFDFSYDGAMRSFEESLERLGLDRIDILHIHDPDDHYEEAISGAYRALDQLRADGVIGAVSAGMNQAEMLTRFAREADFDCFLLAGRYTLLDQIALKELLPVCLERGIAINAGGVYTDRARAEDPRRLRPSRRPAKSGRHAVPSRPSRCDVRRRRLPFGGAAGRQPEHVRVRHPPCAVARPKGRPPAAG